MSQTNYRLLESVSRVAAKAHVCIWCGQAIRAGDTYWDERSVYDFRIQRQRWHPECNAASAEYFRSGEGEEFTPWENERPQSNQFPAEHLRPGSKQPTKGQS